MLENFRTQKIIWDRANKKIFEAIEANSGDSNGRKLVVQVINQEVTESLSGTTLSLGWKSRNGAKGLDAFNVVDASKGIFEIYYTTEMLSNIGNIEASLILIDSTSRIESSTFTISVRPSTVDDESVESENSFTALTEALVKVNDFDARLAQKVDKGNVSVSDINKNLGKLDQTYMAEEFLQQMAGNTPINAVPADLSITSEKLAEKSVTNSKLSDYYNTRDRIYNSGNLNDYTKEGLWFKPSGSNPSHTPTEIIGNDVVLSVSVFSHSSLGTFIMQTLNPLGNETVKYARSFKLGDVPPEFKNTSINSIERTLTDAERYIREEPPTELTNQMASIRDIEVIGADPETPLKIWMICRDFTTWHDRIMITRKQNGQWETYLDSGIDFEVQENEVGYTPVEFISKGVTFRAKIDYSAIPSGGRMIQGSTVDVEPYYIIPQKNVRLTENGTGGGGGEAYDQQLNTFNDVEFNSVKTNTLDISGTIPTGTLSSPPSGLLSGDMWADTTDSSTHPIVRVML